MASTPSDILGSERQAKGENTGTWGQPRLNNSLDRIEEGATGREEVALSGDTTLTTTQYVANQSRWKWIDFTDGGLSADPTVAFPAKERYWIVNNVTGYGVICKASGSSVTVTIPDDKWAMLRCDGTDIVMFDFANLGGEVPIAALPEIPLTKLPEQGNLTVLGNVSGSSQTPSAVTVSNDATLANASQTELVTEYAAKTYIDNLSAASDLGTVASISNDIRLLADIEDGTTATNAITNVSSNSGAVVTVSTNMDDVSRVSGVLVPSSASDPATRADGSALQTGDIYFNTTSNDLRVYNGTSWQTGVTDPGSFVQGPGSTTENNIPQWDSTTRHLKDGLVVGTGANNLLQLDASGNLPAVGGGNLTGVSAVSVETFTESGTWTKQAGATLILVEMRGPGGGGASGRRGAAGTNRIGGGGGGGGGFVSRRFRADELGATVNITLGAPGTGGAAVTTNDTNGNDGTDGGNTTFGDLSTAHGGNGGGGGTTSLTTITGGAGGAPLGVNLTSGGPDGGFSSGESAASITAGGGGGRGSSGGGGGSSVDGGLGGGGGGGVISNDTTSWGGADGGNRQTDNGDGDSTAGAGSDGDDANGAQGGAIAFDGGNGGPGGTGNGGGGGGGSTNGTNSGAGGDGDTGFVRVTTFF